MRRGPVHRPGASPEAFPPAPRAGARPATGSARRTGTNERADGRRTDVPGRVSDSPEEERAGDGSVSTAVGDRTCRHPNLADDHPAVNTPTNHHTGPDPVAVFGEKNFCISYVRT